MRVNAWHDNLLSQDIPPAWMWPFEDELSTWFERVEAERKERYGGGTDDGAQEAPMMSNAWRPEDDE